MEHVADLDQSERDARSTAASTLVGPLAERGIVGVATTYVDNSGVARVKAVPLERLPHLAAWGVGTSVAFDRFRFDDWIAGAGQGREAVGDLRVMPDVRRVVPLGGTSGWAWAPADRYTQDGVPHDQCGRLLLSSLVASLDAQGISMKAAVEIEWAVSHDTGDDDFHPAARGPAYGMGRLVDAADYSRDVLVALAESGVTVEQFHPEYAPGQLEISVAAEEPVTAADTSVLVRTVISAVAARHGLRTSFSPKVAVPGVGNGGHVHFSLWRSGVNLMSGGPTAHFGLSAEGESFAAGVLTHLPALMAVGAPGATSYLRQLPSHWAGAYACWGLENREAAVRMVTGSPGATAIGRQRRGQVLRPPRQPVPGLRRPGRGRPRGPRCRLVAAGPRRRRPRRAARVGACVARHSPPADLAARGGRRLRRRRGRPRRLRRRPRGLDRRDPRERDRAVRRIDRRGDRREYEVAALAPRFAGRAVRPATAERVETGESVRGLDTGSPRGSPGSTSDSHSFRWSSREAGHGRACRDR